MKLKHLSAVRELLLAIHILRFVTDIVDSPDELPLIIKVAQEEAWKNMTTMHRHNTAGSATETEEDKESWPS